MTRPTTLVTTAAGPNRPLRACGAAFLVSLACLAGCGKSPFGGETKTKLDGTLISKYSLKDEDFKQLQYYLAADVVFSRQVSKEDKSERVKGKLVERKGEVVEEVVISKGTPGVCLKSETKDGQHTLDISFEEGTSVQFSSSTYSLTSFTVKTDGSSKIEFGGNKYTSDPKTPLSAAHLEVGVESLEKNEKQRKTLGGRKLEQ